MNVHFKGVFFLTQTLLPLIANGGRIVNLSSGLTRFAYPGYAAYAAMKGAVQGAATATANVATRRHSRRRSRRRIRGRGSRLLSGRL